VPSVRALVTDDDLDRLLPHLPPEAGEVLTALAAGISLDDALEEVSARTPPAAAAAPAAPTIDVTTFRRRWRATRRSASSGSSRMGSTSTPRSSTRSTCGGCSCIPDSVGWRGRTKGPTRVLGGAGTGKTVVALHRAAFLVREVFTKPDDRVLFTTFNVNLASDLQAQLAKLLEPDRARAGRGRQPRRLGVALPAQPRDRGQARVREGSAHALRCGPRGLRPR
jgi:hypothetical protein